jgi:hypothetical protein
MTAELDWFDSQLGDRRYLVGDSFGRADIPVASLLAALARPIERSLYRRVIVPRPLEEMLTKWSGRPSMRWVTSVYAEHPRGSGGGWPLIPAVSSSDRSRPKGDIRTRILNELIPAALSDDRFGWRAEFRPLLCVTTGGRASAGIRYQSLSDARRGAAPPGVDETWRRNRFPRSSGARAIPTSERL